MSEASLVDKIAEAILYEGYILYPYRASSRKNRERFTFGRVYPRDYSVLQHGAEPCEMRTAFLARRQEDHGAVEIRLRFLHPIAREVSADSATFTPVPELRVDDRVYQGWHEATEREVTLPRFELGAEPQRVGFAFPASESFETLHDSDGRASGRIRRRQEAISGFVEAACEAVDARVFRISLRVSNETPIDADARGDALLLRTLASTHAIFHGHGAEFLSLTDPPAEYSEAAAACVNIGAWPVLVGDSEGPTSDTMLASPIILYDFPKIAPESPGALCDGLEIDEILTLRVMTMTDDEKNEMRNVDGFARSILERTESLRGEDLLKMHGTMRDVHFPGGDFFDEKTRLERVCIRGGSVQTGDRVRINPKQRADAIDMMLAGKIGLIEAIEQDAEGRVHLALVIEDDPGRDLGMMRQPGHRFFYAVDEIEPLVEGE